ncbi:hypothetical protein KI387_037777, partial [Taxus chinensis]
MRGCRDARERRNEGIIPTVPFRADIIDACALVRRCRDAREQWNEGIVPSVQRMLDLADAGDWGT